MAEHSRATSGRPARPPASRRLPARRIGLLVGAAVLGAVGFGLISPAAPTANITALAAPGHPSQAVSPDRLEIAAAVQALNDPDNEKSPDRAPGASAVALAQARAHDLAAAAARRAAAAQAAEDAEAAAHEADDVGTAGRDAYRAYARSKVGDAQFACLDRLWERESTWRPAAQNPTSTAYGIAQLLDSTWAVTGIAKTSNGYRQIDAGLAYLEAAYPGGPCSAWAHETSVGWY